jgi:hypothetical protein
LERQYRHTHGALRRLRGRRQHQRKRYLGNVFPAGNYGNGVNFNGNGGSLTFNPGQYQNGGSGNSITLNGNTATTFDSGAYTFCGTVDIAGNSTVTLQPGTYFGGIVIAGNATVTFSPGTYILAGGGLRVTGNSTLKGTGSPSMTRAPPDIRTLRLT